MIFKIINGKAVRYDSAGGITKIDDISVDFSQAESRENISPTDTMKTILGKIMKWFSDLSAGAASSLLGQNLTAGKVLVSDDGGKVAASAIDASKVEFLSGVTGDLQEQINSLNSTLENRFVYVRGGSTISFADAFSKTDTVFGNMSLALDALETNISNYENGIHSVAGSTQNFFVVLCKRTGNTYAGIIMTYLGYNPVFFSRSTGGFSIFFPIKAN